MNDLDDIPLNKQGFAWRDLLGNDRWVQQTFGIATGDVAFATQFSVTFVGTPTATIRRRHVGKCCEFQCSFSSSTSIALVAGTSYMLLPILSYAVAIVAGVPNNLAAGVAGFAALTDDNTHIAIGLCDLDLVNGKCYFPTQAATGHLLKVYGSYEVA